MCFNGSGYSLRVLDRRTGKQLRRLGEEEWSPRKSASFMCACGPRHLLVGFSAPVGCVARGSKPVAHEVALVLPLSRSPSKHRKRKAFRRASAASAASGSRDSEDEDAEEARANGPRSVQVPAWGLECASSLGGNLATGTDNGLVVISDVLASVHHRIIDPCAASGMRSHSAKTGAVCLAGTRLFVALQSPAERDSEGYRGRLVSFDFQPTELLANGATFDD